MAGVPDCPFILFTTPKEMKNSIIEIMMMKNPYDHLNIFAAAPVVSDDNATVNPTKKKRMASNDAIAAMRGMTLFLCFIDRSEINPNTRAKIVNMKDKIKTAVIAILPEVTSDVVTPEVSFAGAPTVTR
jgi:hypothetical protein